MELTASAKCFFCDRPFSRNDELEHFAHARRVAFDPHRGRLWAVCEHCRQWSLAPFESRWEALEQLERIARDHARLLVQGENVALLETATLEIIRVGRAPLAEEAWWRYGRELLSRDQRARRIVRRGQITDVVSWLLLIGFPVWFASNADFWINQARRRVFGRLAWSGSGACTRCGRSATALDYTAAPAVRVVNADGGLGLTLPCSGCRTPGVLVGGQGAIDTLRRLLAYHNFRGAQHHEISTAAQIIEGAGSPGALVDRIGARQLSLRELDSTGALALEIALNDAWERAQLEAEVIELESQWRAAEEIAEIIDGELT